MKSALVLLTSRQIIKFDLHKNQNAAQSPPKGSPRRTLNAARVRS
jgi:hypothetical protein